MGLIISEGIVKSSDPSSAKESGPSSERVCDTGEDDEANIWRGDGDGQWREGGNLGALAGLLAVEGDMDRFSSITVWNRLPNIILRVNECNGVATLEGRPMDLSRPEKLMACGIP